VPPALSDKLPPAIIEALGHTAVEVRCGPIAGPFGQQACGNLKEGHQRPQS